MDRKSFFVFLDIDNTMWDDFDDKKNNLKKGMSCKNVSKESAHALNYFLFCLFKCGYNPRLVITSGDRKEWDDCKLKLYSAGLYDDFDLIKFPIDKNRSRWERVGVMLHDDLKGRKDIKFLENRKYNLFDRLHFNFYNKVNNFAVIQSCVDGSMVPLLTISIGAGEKLSKNKIDLFMIRNGLDAADKIMKEYGISHFIENQMGEHKIKLTYFDFINEAFEKYVAIKNNEIEEKMTQSSASLHKQTINNKKKRFYKSKISRINNSDYINKDYDEQEDSNLQME